MPTVPVWLSSLLAGGWLAGRTLASLLHYIRGPLPPSLQIRPLPVCVCVCPSVCVCRTHTHRQFSVVVVVVVFVVVVSPVVVVVVAAEGIAGCSSVNSAADWLAGSRKLNGGLWILAHVD